MNFTKKVFYKYTYRPLIIYQTIWGHQGSKKLGQVKVKIDYQNIRKVEITEIKYFVIV